jgi:hypothetical protein
MVTGADSYVNYGYETTFASAVSATKTFGLGVKLSSAERKNNLKEVYGLGSRNAQSFIDSKFEGTLSVEFEVANPWFLYAVLGGVPSAAGEGPYTWTFAEANVPPSLTITNGINLSTDAVIAYLGCICTDAKISCDNDGAAHATLNFVYAKETKATSGIGSQVAETESPFPFCYNTWDLGSSAIATTQSVEISIENNAEIIAGLGSRLGTGSLFKQRAYKVSLVNQFTDASVYLEKVYGVSTGPAATTASSEVTTANLILDNGGSTTAQRKYTFAFSGLKFDSEAIPQSLEEMITESVDGMAKSCSVTVINNTDAMP